VRIELPGGELLYGMRVVSHWPSTCAFPKPAIPRVAGPGTVKPPPRLRLKPVEFYPYPEVPAEAVQTGKRLVSAGGLDVAGIEYLEMNGRRIFCDANANSNLRRPVGEAFGFDPFDRAAEWLEAQIA
jgi:hypothetical protein